MAWLQDALRSLSEDLPLAGLMLVVTLGFLVGRLSFRGVSLGPAGGTLGVALLLGSLGLSFRALYGRDDPALTVGSLGFALFIYSVGFEAGPRFFNSLFGGPGWRVVVVGVFVNVLAVSLAVGCGRLFSLSDSVTAGVLSGALTSAPTYAAADEVCSDRTALAVSFALVYPVGLACIILLVQILPRLMRDDLAAGADVPDEEDVPGSGDPEQLRMFEVTGDDVAGRTLEELELSRRTGCYITSLHRGDRVFIPDASTKLEEGDHVMVKGRVHELQRFGEIIGKEVEDADLRRRGRTFRRVRVQDPKVVGKSLRTLQLTRRHHALVTLIHRGPVSIEPSADLCLERDDVVEVIGDHRGLRALASELGRFERPTHETDIAVYAGGIFIGLLLSRIHFQGFDFDFRLGTAGGLLLAGVVLGRFRRIGPLSAHVPLAARQLVRDLGILLFVAETGVKAGGSSLSGLSDTIGPTVLAGTVTTVLPVILAVILARRFLALRALESWGAVCGAMTSSAALVALRRAADSDEPAISYAASYAVASVLVTVAGQVIVFLMA